MPISFEHTLSDPLAPHHYIEFSNAEAFSGMASQSQQLLIVDLAGTSEASKMPRNTVLSLAEVKEKGIELTANLQAAVNSAAIAAPGVAPSVLALIKAGDFAGCLPETQFTQIALCSDDKPLIEAAITELDRRWGHDLQLEGHLFVASSKKVSELKAIASINSMHLSLIPMPSAKDSSGEWAAAFAAVNAQYASDPARPYQNLNVAGLACIGDGFKLTERDDLLKSGVSTWRKVGETIVIDRLVTTYTKNATGATDPSYRDLNTKQILSYLRFDFRNYIATSFPRHMLAKDDFPYEGPVITPKMAKVFAISRYRLWQKHNLVQDPGEQFAKNVRVEVDERTPGKLNFYLPVHVMGQWRVTQTSIAFKL